MAFFVVDAGLAVLRLTLCRRKSASEHVVSLDALLIALIPRNRALEFQALVLLALFKSVENAGSIFNGLFGGLASLLSATLGGRIEESSLCVGVGLILGRVVCLAGSDAPELKFSILWKCLCVCVFARRHADNFGSGAGLDLGQVVVGRLHHRGVLEVGGQVTAAANRIGGRVFARFAVRLSETVLTRNARNVTAVSWNMSFFGLVTECDIFGLDHSLVTRVPWNLLLRI